MLLLAPATPTTRNAPTVAVVRICRNFFTWTSLLLQLVLRYLYLYITKINVTSITFYYIHKRFALLSVIGRCHSAVGSA